MSLVAMRGYWHFDLVCPASKRRLLVVFCAAERPDPEGVAEVVEAYCNEHRPPDHVYLIAPVSEDASMREVGTSQKFLGRVRGVTRYHDAPGAEVLLFDEMGGVSSQDKARPVPPETVNAIKRQGMTWIVRNHPVVHPATLAHHFVLPSGKHSQSFFRIGSAMADGSAIDFMAFCCLPHIPIDTRHIYCDTGAISPVGYAVGMLRKRITPDSASASVCSFGSYGGAKNFEFSAPGKSVILISLTLTDELSGHLRQIEPGLSTDGILALYALCEPKGTTRVICDLRSNATSNPMGYEPVETSDEKGCSLCARGSSRIMILSDQFLPGHTKVEAVMIRAQDRPKWLGPVLRQVVGAGLVRANHRSEGTRHASAEVFFDLQKLFEDSEMLGIAAYKKRFLWMTDQATPAMLNRIICLDSPASEAMANRIAKHVSDKLANVEVIKYSTVVANLDAHVRESGATLVVAAAAASGRSLLAVSQVLRSIQKNGAINYLVGFARFRSKEAFTEVESNVAYGEQPRDHGFFVIERVFLPLAGKSEVTTWASELELINSLLVECDEGESKSLLEARSAAIRAADGRHVRGMADDLFWTKGDESPLRLRPGFAFFDFTPQGTVSQADVYFTIVAILHELRSSSDGALYPHEHLRRVLSPRCFERFNDGVIQACLLRAARPLELDYSVSETHSAAMSEFLDVIFSTATSETGEAAREFLLSLALKRLRLTPEDMEHLKNRYATTCTDPICKLLWARIG